jgi:multicomponent Na+:H+ antiporter subunit C
MIGLSSLVVGVLFAVAIYLLLSRNVQRVALGLIVMGNGVNLLVLTASGLPEGAIPPLLDGTEGAHADPLPQAFILTAIVIGLGTAALALGMVARTHRELGTDQLQEAEWE